VGQKAVIIDVILKRFGGGTPRLVTI
jgi:hypothetical protein